MEHKNLVARIPSETDHRANKIFMTAKGEKILKKTEPVIEKMVSEMQAGISEQERVGLIKTLKKLMDNIKSEDLVALETK
jgi:DNA-binding MarR family transcriptional regulator